MHLTDGNKAQLKHKRLLGKVTTKPALRVAIAKDVLKWLTDKRQFRLKPTFGTYLSGGLIRKQARPMEVNTPLAPLLEEMGECKVCALGAAFLATVDLLNDVSVYLKEYGDFEYSSGEMRTQLRKAFSEKDLSCIESAFESSDYNLSDFVGLRTQNAVYKYGEMIKDPKKRLKRIMQNIVDNNGTFSPCKEVWPDATVPR